MLNHGTGGCACVQNAREREKKKRFVLESVSSTSFFLGEENTSPAKKKKYTPLLKFKSVHVARSRAPPLLASSELCLGKQLAGGAI